MTYPSGIQLENGYNARGYLSTVTDTATSTILKTLSKVDAFGNITLENYGNGVKTARVVDAKTGRLTDIDTTLGNASFQNNQYAWQSNGILESRTRVNASTTLREDFGYDGLNRLEKSESFVNSVLSRTLDTAYDIRGNLSAKTSSIAADTDVTNYQYTTGKNRLSSVTIGGAGYALGYDLNGNIEQYDRAGSGDDRFIAWNARNLPTTVVVGNSLEDTTPTAKDEFDYGPDGQRYYKKSTWDDSGTQWVEHTFYVGSFEELITDTSNDTQLDSVQKSRIGNSVIHIKSFPDTGSPTSSIEYLHRDHLGSVESVTDEQGNELRILAYDPFGERRKEDWLTQLNESELQTLADDLRKSTSRGFTGQENLDRTGFVHMNGRIYDPQLGRFLSPDPIVQSPGYSQSWNRYSYAMNSPMSFDDRSGYVRQPSNPNVFCATTPTCVNLTGSGNFGGGIVGSTGTFGVPRVLIAITSRVVRIFVPRVDFIFGGDGRIIHGFDYYYSRRGVAEVVDRFSRDINVTESSQTDEPIELDDLPSRELGRKGLDRAIREQIDQVSSIRRSHRDRSDRKTYGKFRSHMGEESFGGFIFEGTSFFRTSRLEIDGYTLGRVSAETSRGIIDDPYNNPVGGIQKGASALVVGVEPSLSIQSILNNGRFFKLSRTVGAPVFVLSNEGDVVEFFEGNSTRILR